MNEITKNYLEDGEYFFEKNRHMCTGFDPRKIYLVSDCLSTSIFCFNLISRIDYSSISQNVINIIERIKYNSKICSFGVYSHYRQLLKLLGSIIAPKCIVVKKSM